MKLVAISDTHNQHSMMSVGSGDVLIHAGDATGMGRVRELESFIEWFSAQDFKHKIYVPGNHDIGLEDGYEERSKWFTDAGIILLNDESIIVDGVSIDDFEEYSYKIHGSPITLNFGNWAFMRAPGAEIAKHWDLIPADIDILVTHGPPKYILDEVIDTWRNNIENTGCAALANKVLEIKPKYHIFGHIHEGAGAIKLGSTEYINASQLDERYKLVHAPIVRKL